MIVHSMIVHSMPRERVAPHSEVIRAMFSEGSPWCWVPRTETRPSGNVLFVASHSLTPAPAPLVYHLQHTPAGSVLNYPTARAMSTAESAIGTQRAAEEPETDGSTQGDLSGCFGRRRSSRRRWRWRSRRRSRSKRSRRSRRSRRTAIRGGANLS